MITYSINGKQKLSVHACQLDFQTTVQTFRLNDRPAIDIALFIFLYRSHIVLIADFKFPCISHFPSFALDIGCKYSIIINMRCYESIVFTVIVTLTVNNTQYIQIQYFWHIIMIYGKSCRTLSGIGWFRVAGCRTASVDIPLTILDHIISVIILLLPAIKNHFFKAAVRMVYADIPAQGIIMQERGKPKLPGFAFFEY